MTRRSSIALLVLAAVTGVLIVVFGSNSTVKLVSTQVVTIPSRGPAVEFVLKNNSKQSSGYYFYSQKWFDGGWVPKTVTPYQRADEGCYVSAGHQATVTLRVPDSGGRFRFHICYGVPPPLHQRLFDLTRKKLGLRGKGLHGRWEAMVTEPIQVPPV